MPEPNAQPQVGDDSTATQGGAGAAGGANGGDAIPEYVKELRQEAAARRIEAKKLREELAELRAQSATPAVKPDAHGANGNGKDAAGGDVSAAQLSESRAMLQEAKARIEALEKRDAERAASAAKKLLRAELTRVLTEAKVQDVDEAVIYLEARGARLAEDDRAVIDVSDEGGEQTTILVKPDLLRKHRVLKDHWFPPAGVGGSGSAAPRGAPAGVDLERAKTDLKYFEEHEKEVLAHRRAQGTR